MKREALLAILVVLLGMLLLSQTLRAMSADAAEDCRPRVVTVDHTVRVGNRCDTDALVIVWKPYHLSAETFTAPAHTYTVHPTLHTGRVRVWLRFDDGTEQTYRKRVHQ